MCVCSKRTNLSLTAPNSSKTAGERLELQIPLAQDPSPSVTSGGSHGKRKITGSAYIDTSPNSSPILDFYNHATFIGHS